MLAELSRAIEVGVEDTTEQLEVTTRVMHAASFSQHLGTLAATALLHAKCQHSLRTRRADPGIQKDASAH